MRSHEAASSSPVSEPVLDWPAPCDLSDLDERHQELHRRITDADPAALPAILEEAARRCRSDDPASIRVYAAALLLADDPHQAVGVLHHLAGQQPADVPTRIDLARADIAVGFIEDAAAQLTTAAELAAGQPGISAEIRRRHDELAGWQRWAAAHVRFHELRAAAFRERAGAGLNDPDEQAALAYSLLLLQGQHRDPAALIGEAIEVLEATRRIAPRHERTLELLTAAYLQGGRDEQWHRALRELEEVAPHSQLVERMGQLGPATDRSAEGQRDFLGVLVQRAGAGDAEAFDQLRAKYRRNPEDVSVACALMLVEAMAGDLEFALRMADHFAAEPEPGHTLHFHLAQVYAAAGRLADVERHLDLADRTADTPADHADVAALREMLEANRSRE
jgi:predicted Zn-dependent protease